MKLQLPRKRITIPFVLMLVAGGVHLWREHQRALPEHWDGSYDLETVAVPAAGSGEGAGAGARPPAATPGPDWSHWRGPAGNGISPEKDWFSPWPPQGPKRFWKATLGAGYSSFALAGGRLYTMGNLAGRDVVYCLDAATGSALWKHSYPCGSDPSYPGPRATPTVDGDRVYTLSRKGHLFCLDAATGKLRWAREAARDAGARLPQWDLGGSVLVAGRLLVLNVGSAGLALDKETGETVWSSGKGPSGYATPVPYELQGRQGVALFGFNRILGLDPADGKLLWEHPWSTGCDVNAADPIVTGDKVFFSSGYGTGCALVQFEPGPPRVLWKNQNLAEHFSSPILLDGCIYGFDGNAGSQGSLRCLDLATGELKWSHGGLVGSLVAADGKLLILSELGELLVVEASPAAYKELARAQLVGGQCFTVPLLSGARAYCRNTAGEVLCVSTRGE